MGSAVCLQFLGTVQVERDGEPVRGFRSRKALALLGYLAVQGDPVPRERLVDLLWEDRSETKGRTNLSWVLGRISSLLPNCLRADWHTVHFRCPPGYWLDLHAFEELEGQGDLDALAGAAALYRGDFLEGLRLEGVRGVRAVGGGGVGGAPQQAGGVRGGGAGCGAPDREVAFRVGSQDMIPTTAWDNNRVWELELRPIGRIYLPLVLKGT